MHIALRRSVPKTLRSEIKDHYLAAIPECGNEEIGYINHKFERLIKRLESSTNDLEKDIAKYASGLHALILEEAESGFEKHHRYVVAALFYLCNPYDVIPDFNVQDGYLDDAIAINLCMAELRKNAKNSYGRLQQLVDEGKVLD